MTPCASRPAATSSPDTHGRAEVTERQPPRENMASTPEAAKTSLARRRSQLRAGHRAQTTPR
eukprot:7872281-Pyramimonas_sp.AAC.1